MTFHAGTALDGKYSSVTLMRNRSSKMPHLMHASIHTCSSGISEPNMAAHVSSRTNGPLIIPKFSGSNVHDKNEAVVQTNVTTPPFLTNAPIVLKKSGASPQGHTEEH